MRARTSRLAVLVVTAALLGTGLAACDATSSSTPQSIGPAAQPSSAQPSTAQPSTAQPSTAQPSTAQPSTGGTSSPSRTAGPRTLRLEVGPQVGYRFSTSGAELSHKHLLVSTAPLLVTSDGRRTVPTRTGFYLHVATGALAGYEVRESPVAYLTGQAGNTRFPSDKMVTLPVGGFLGYRFTGTWGLDGTEYGQVTTATTALAGRRAVINGRAYLLMTSGDWSGWWLPATQPRGLRAQKITCSVPAKPAAGASQVLTRIDTDESRLALTFDMGGRLDPALQIVERLVIDRVCATVNPTGATAQTATGTAVMTLIAAHPELFEVGNHTMNHCDLVAGGGAAACPDHPLTTAEIQAELTAAQQVIHDLTGWAVKPLWRPPMGAYDAHALAAAAAIGYTKTLMWDVDTIDWKKTVDGGPTAAQIADKVVTKASAGSLVLMHLGGYHTYDALPSMVLRLRAAGLRPTTVSDLLD